MGFVNNPVDTSSLARVGQDNNFSTKQTFAGEVEIDGNINHDGSNVGFFGVVPVARPSAYTQTYSTASKTVPAMTSADVSTAAAGLAVFGYSQAQADSIPAAINALRVDMANSVKVTNALIDDLQALGLVI